MPDGLFIFFAALTLAAAAMLVLSRNPVTSAMGMILALVGVAADFFLLDARGRQHREPCDRQTIPLVRTALPVLDVLIDDTL